MRKNLHHIDKKIKSILNLNLSIFVNYHKKDLNNTTKRLEKHIEKREDRGERRFTYENTIQKRKRWLSIERKRASHVIPREIPRPEPRTLPEDNEGGVKAGEGRGTSIIRGEPLALIV